MLANVDISAMAIPDFIAGFVYGMTGDNHLTEIEACYAGGELMEQEIVTGIADIKHGGTDYDIQAGLQFALAATQIPVALNTCKNMGDDLTAIEQWASIFRDPAKLAKHLATHYALHKGQITTDIQTLETDWDAQNYFKAGTDLADLATLAIGPINTADYWSLPDQMNQTIKDTLCYDDFTLNTVEVADFLAGFVHGFTGNDHKAYFETCFKDTDAFEVDVCNVVKGIASKDNQQIIEALGAFMGDMPELGTFLAACPDASADIATTSNWFKYWKSQGTMKVYSTAYKNVINNMPTIKADANTMETDFDAQDYYGTADMASTVAKIALPVPAALGVTPVTTKCTDRFSLNTTEIADFIAGFMSGFTGNDDKAYMESCFQDTAAFESTMCTVVEDFMTKDNQKMIEGVHLLMGQMSTINGFLAGCPNASADIATTESWMKYWKAQGTMKLYSTAYKNLVSNMATVKADANDLETAYDAGDYYTTAQDASKLAVLALPLPSLGDVACDAKTSLNTVELADFIAGFIKGFTGNDHKAEMETCFKDTDAFEMDVCSIIKALETKDNQQIMMALQKLVQTDLPELNSFMASCPTAATDFAVVGNWFKYWKAQGTMKVYSTAYKNVVGNMPTIKADVDVLETDYDAKDYFGTAVEASTIAKIALPVEQALF